MRVDWELEQWGVSTVGRLGAFLADAAAIFADDPADDGGHDVSEDDAADVGEDVMYDGDAGESFDIHVAHAQWWAWEDSR